MKEKFVKWVEELKGMLEGMEDDEKRELKKEVVELLKVEKGEGRKEEVLRVLREKGRVKIEEIAKELGISAKNVSSQIVYLKKKGVKVATDSEGKKFIEE